MPYTIADNPDEMTTMPILVRGAAVTLVKIAERDDADDLIHNHLDTIRQILTGIETLMLAAEEPEGRA